MSAQLNSSDVPQWILDTKESLEKVGYECQPLAEFSGAGVVCSRNQKNLQNRRKTLLVMRSTPRLGNFIRSVKNIYAYSSAADSKYDVHFRHNRHENIIKIGNKRIQGVRLNRSTFRPKTYSTVVLHNNFFKIQDQKLAELAKSSAAISFARKTLRFLEPKQKKLHQTPGGELLIHLRSGDIFESDTPHPAYYQPPLGFYKAVIRDVQPESVCLLLEDFGNPVADALIRHIHGQGIQVRLAGKDLKETISLILNAKKLVFGQGTFVNELLSLSDSVETTYTLEGFGAPLANNFKEFKSVVYESNCKELETLKPWKNTLKQRESMISIDGQEFSRN